MNVHTFLYLDSKDIQVTLARTPDTGELKRALRVNATDEMALYDCLNSIRRDLEREMERVWNRSTGANV